jgi:hypothetical protein
MKKLLTLALLFAAAPSAAAWNDKGHMVAARLAWERLTDKQRLKVIEVLKKHPHYDEFLAAKRPSGFSEPEWVFMRAATWSDWVRRHHRQYDRPGTTSIFPSYPRARRSTPRSTSRRPTR